MIAWDEELVDSIARRRAVIVLGSGASANSTTTAGDKPPTWGDFLQNSYTKLGKKIEHIAQALNRYDYLSACDFIKYEYGSSWAAHLRSIFLTPRYRAADIHQHIFNLDARLVVSLNFDKIYENYASRNSDRTVVVKNYYDEDIRQAIAGSGRYILKPHGSIDTTTKLIFSISDYAAARVNYASFYEIFNSLLHTHTFLLIRCGLSDPDVQVLFEDYRLKFDECPHYMTYPRPIAEAEINLIQRTRGISILPYDPDSGHAELMSSLGELVNSVNQRRDEIAISQDW